TKAAISFNGVPYPDPNYASAIYANSAANPAQDLGLQLFNLDGILNLVQLIAYTDWNETQQKQPDGRWVNYNYDWMFKPGAMKQVA
ncbi:hypothetical protein MJM95_27895, partial [Salmonella enterica subsp. enterica serovar Anatum]|nr:hypothetical protein [Salmonella enterica subsp. enterica serovar Anatum]